MSAPLIAAAVEVAAERFKSAVLQSEQSRDADPLIALFAEDAVLDSPAHEQPLRGAAGSTKFWTDYLDAFKSVTSTFTTSRLHGDIAVLEWKSTGVLPTDRKIDYRGVSIVTFAGEKISAFVTYYDSAQFVAETGKPAAAVASGATNNEGGD